MQKCPILRRQTILGEMCSNIDLELEALLDAQTSPCCDIYLSREEIQESDWIGFVKSLRQVFLMHSFGQSLQNDNALPSLKIAKKNS